MIGEDDNDMMMRAMIMIAVEDEDDDDDSFAEDRLLFLHWGYWNLEYRNVKKKRDVHSAGPLGLSMLRVDFNKTFLGNCVAVTCTYVHLGA